MSDCSTSTDIGVNCIGAGIRVQVYAYLVDYFMADVELDEATLLVDDLGADSLDLLHVVQAFNDMFCIDIDADLLPRMLTVGGVCEVVELKLQCRSIH